MTTTDNAVDQAIAIFGQRTLPKAYVKPCGKGSVMITPFGKDSMPAGELRKYLRKTHGISARKASDMANANVRGDINPRVILGFAYVADQASKSRYPDYGSEGKTSSKLVFTTAEEKVVEATVTPVKEPTTREEIMAEQAKLQARLAALDAAKK